MTAKQKLGLIFAILAAVWGTYRTATTVEALRYAEKMRLADSLATRARDQVTLADSLARVAIAVRDRYEKDTLKLVVWRTRWDTLKAGIDTQWLRDTAPVPAAVVRTVVQTADSTIRACGVALTRCDSLQSIQGARADSLRSAARTWEAAAKAATAVRRPLWKRIALKAAEWAAVGRAARALP